LKQRFVVFIGALIALGMTAWLTPVMVSGQSGAATVRSGTAQGASLKTKWGDPDLEGIWREDVQVPLQRDPKYAGREFLTDQEVAAADARKAKNVSRDKRQDVGTEKDVAGAYNAVFQSMKYTGRRTSEIVDPPDGRIPPLTPEAQKRAAETRAYLDALLQGTSGGKPGPISPRRYDSPPYYNVDRINRSDGPEDRSLAERCLASEVPNWNGFNRVVQSADAVSVFYDIGQGQGFQRVIPLSTSPHLPSQIRQWWGDSRGHWEGNTLVVDVTNFDPKQNFQGSHENLHVVERWTRLDANTLEYMATIADPTVWTKPWTVKVELNRQEEKPNRIYYEPRCHEGNYGLAGMMQNTRAAEHAFAEGRGPDPALQDNATPGGGEAFEDGPPPAR
jgi:hypothetical protein